MVKWVVCVEGLIGVGKSTLCKHVEKENIKGVKVLQEPVDDWRGCEISDGKNLLECMYDGTIPSSLFQLSVLQSRFGPLVQALCNPEVDVVVSERGPWSEKYVFAKSNLNDAEFKCYEYAHAALIRDLLPVCGSIKVLFLHLSMPADSVMERIAKRGRAEEAGITEEYLKKLESAHVDMKKALKLPEHLGSCSIAEVKTVDIYADQSENDLASVAVDTISRMCV
jgi:deoxyadenosine/deoxycytidine kinase